MLTAAVTCGRAVRAGLASFRYDGEAAEAVESPRTSRRSAKVLAARGSCGAGASSTPAKQYVGLDRKRLDRLGLVRHGYGTITYKSGSRYAGEWEHDRRCGVGTFEYCNGDVYKGQWKGGRYEGRGSYTAAPSQLAADAMARGRGLLGGDALPHGRSDEYDGEWHADKPHGWGRYVYSATGDVYEGQWVNGLREGEGRVICADGTVFEGLYECGERVRVALNSESLLAGVDERGVRIRMFTATLTCELSAKADLDECIYEGETRPAERPDGATRRMPMNIPGRVRHGHGRIVYSCGNVYEGGWAHDKRSGVGTYVYACGDKYVGEWKEGRYDGRGHYVGSENGGGGDEYEGEWRTDQPHGHGRYVYRVSGDVYEGQFRQGQWHGKGRYTSAADGHEKDGEWREGLFVPIWQRQLSSDSTDSSLLDLTHST